MDVTANTNPFTLAAVNFSPVYGDKDATLARILDNVREAGKQGADLVVFPEGALQGPGSCEHCRERSGPCDGHLAAAETIPGPATAAVSALAAEFDLYVCFGMPERDPDDPSVLYNAVAVVGPEGVLGSYRKVHLGSLPWVTEGITYRPGTELPVFDTRFGRIGVQICYDFWFNPELTRILALKGADVIVNCAGSFNAPGRKASMTATALSRASENLVHVVTANIAGGSGAPESYAGSELAESTRGRAYTGNSLITGPAFPRFAEVLAQAGDEEEIISATINPARSQRWESVFPWRDWRTGRLSSASELVAREFQTLAGESESAQPPRS